MIRNSVIMIAASLVLAGCLSDQEKALVTKYAASAGISYDSALEKMSELQKALKYSGDYAGIANGVPNEETTIALKRYVDKARRKNGSSQKGKPTQIEIDAMISDYREHLQELATSNSNREDRAGGSGSTNVTEVSSETFVSGSITQDGVTETYTDEQSFNDALAN